MAIQIRNKDNKVIAFGELLKSASADYAISVYVPSTQNSFNSKGVKHTNALTPEAHTLFVRGFSTLLAKSFGGATETTGFGSWVDDKTGELISEPVTIVTSALNSNDPKHVEALENVGQFVASLKGFLSQDAVLVQIYPIYSFFA